MEIRRATFGDAGPLSDVAMETYVQAFGHTFSATDLANHLEMNLSPARFEQYLKDDIILLAEVDQQIVGYVQAGSYNLSPNHGRAADQEIRRLYVTADFQNQRIGTQLIEAILSHPRMTCAENIFLDVWEHNLAAQRLYRRFGFEVVGARAFEVGSRAETDLDLIMVRRNE